MFPTPATFLGTFGASASTTSSAFSENRTDAERAKVRLEVREVIEARVRGAEVRSLNIVGFSGVRREDTNGRCVGKKIKG